MKSFFVMAAMALAMVVTTQAQPAIGLYGGLNRSIVSGDVPSEIRYQTLNGPIVGLIGEFYIAPEVKLSLQPQFVQRGTNVAIKIAGLTHRRDSLNLVLNYISVPLLVKVEANKGRTYVTSGLDVAYLNKATITGGAEDEDVKALLNNVALSFNFGFGAVFPIGKPLLMVEVRYAQNILNVNDPDSQSDDRPLPVRFRTSGFQLLAGVLLPLGKRR